MGITVDSIWNKAQRLSPYDRLVLSRMLQKSVHETEAERKKRVASEIDRFFVGWSKDERSTEEIMKQIREGRTTNTFYLYG